MKSIKKALVAGLAVLVMGAGSVSLYALSEYETPAEALAALTGSDTETILADREEGETCWTIAEEEGVLDEFRDEVLAIHKDKLDERVAAGTLTQERADEILARMEENIGEGGMGRGLMNGTGEGHFGARAGSRNGERQQVGGGGGRQSRGGNNGVCVNP